MVRKIVIMLLMVMFLSSFVVAQDAVASIRVKTLPGHTVYLSVLDPFQDAYSYVILKGVSDEYGDVFFDYSTNKSGEDSFNLQVKVKKASTQVIPKIGPGVFFEEVYDLGEDIYLEVFNEGDEIIPTPGLDDDIIEEVVEVVINLTEDVIEEVVEIVDGGLEDAKSNSSGSWIAGNSVSDLVKGPAVYGGVGAVFILGIIALFIVGRRRKNKVKASNKSVAGHSSSSKSETHDSDLSKAESRLKSVQAEVQRLKGQDKVSEVRKRIAAEEEELRKLRSGKI